MQVAESDEKREADDMDVSAEKDRLLKMADSPQRDMISIVGLRKVYAPPRPGMKPHMAVEGLHLGIPEGQCFGYLGVNGAGKTTTLKMLTNDVAPTGGVAFLNNLNILTQQQDVRALLGYCPQFDSLVCACDCLCLSCIALSCIALRCVALHCIALRCIALHCVALHCIALHCIALHCIALH